MNLNIALDFQLYRQNRNEHDQPLWILERRPAFSSAELGSSTGVTSRDIAIVEPRSTVDADYRFLLARLPRLGLGDDRCEPETLRRILRARAESEIDQQRRRFSDKVDEYLQKLRIAEEPERELLAQEFKEEADRDLGLLQRDL